jgi:hypothetical protein
MRRAIRFTALALTVCLALQAVSQATTASLRVRESKEMIAWKSLTRSQQESQPSPSDKLALAGSVEWITLHLTFVSPDMTLPSRAGNSAIPSLELAANHQDNTPAEILWRVTGVATTKDRITLDIAAQLPLPASERHRLLEEYADWLQQQPATDSERAALTRSRPILIKGLEGMFLQNAVGDYTITATIHDPRVNGGAQTTGKAELRVVERGSFIDSLKASARKAS